MPRGGVNSLFSTQILAQAQNMNHSVGKPTRHSFCDKKYSVCMFVRSKYHSLAYLECVSIEFKRIHVH